MKTARTLAAFCSILLLLILNPRSGLAQQVGVTGAKSESPATLTDAEKRRQSFELVWQTVNQKFYDPTFNGVNWQALHERYAPLVARAGSDQELYFLLQQMINELHQSHFWIIPPQGIPKLPSEIGQPDENEKADSDEDLGNLNEGGGRGALVDRVRRRLTERLSTGIGIDLRVVDGRVLITRVEPGSTAARAGLRSGFVVKSVNGKPLSKIVADLEQNPIWHDIIRPEIPAILVAEYFDGDLTTALQLTYLDGRNVERRITVRREKLNGEMSPAIGNLPPLFAEFEAKRLAGGLGYIRFNAFVPILMSKVCASLREMHDAPGIIIDLRGNEGGLLGMVSGLVGLLEQYPVGLGRMKTRTGFTSVFAYPQRRAYTGQVAILIDGSTLSAAEMFAAGMQDTSRAVVVGDVSAGNTLPSAIVKLPTGALFQYAFGNYQTPSGVFLEGRGVVPDSIVRVTRRTLLLDGDPQLTAAMKQLRMRLTPPIRRSKEIASVTVRDPVIRVPKRDADPQDPPPPPPKPVANKPQPVPNEKGASSDSGAQMVKKIVDRYIEAVGGETVLRGIKSRVSSGTIELTGAGLTGTVDTYEEEPDRSSVIMNLKGFGIVQQTFNGRVSWMQDPVRGYIEFPKPTKGTAIDLDGELGMKTLVGFLRFQGKDKVGGRDCFVLSVGERVTDRYYFEIESGLLMRKNDMYFEDYRDVDGVKLPFVVRQDLTVGGSVIVRLKEVKHNVPIDEIKFAEHPDCFTKPEQNWRVSN